MQFLAIPDLALQLRENNSQRLPLILLLDRSGSMSGPRIQSLNDGLKALKVDLKNDDLTSQRVQVLTIQFGRDVSGVTISNSSGDATFDDSVLAAARKSQFTPARRGCTPVASTYTVTFQPGAP